MHKKFLTWMPRSQGMMLEAIKHLLWDVDHTVPRPPEAQKIYY